MKNSLKHPKPKVRRQIQRAFFNWLHDNHSAFKHPLKIIRRTDHVIEMTFVGITPAVRAIMTWCIDIPAYKGVRCMDLLASFEAEPIRGKNGYYCGLCPQEERGSYASRDEIWRDEIFNPFLIWVNNQLATASYIEFYEQPSYTAAKLTNVQSSSNCEKLKL